MLPRQAPASPQGDRRCPQRHPLQVRPLAAGLCDACFRRIDVGHGCAICDFDLCDACVVAEHNLGADELLVFSIKTCKKIVGAVDDPKSKMRLIQEVLDEGSRGRRLKAVTGRDLSRSTCLLFTPRRGFTSSSYPLRL